MERLTERIAREITAMQGCGGPLSRPEWMAHVAEELAAVQPVPSSELAELASLLGGSEQRAVHFVHGLEVMCASYAENCSSVSGASTNACGRC